MSQCTVDITKAELDFKALQDSFNEYLRLRDYLDNLTGIVHTMQQYTDQKESLEKNLEMLNKMYKKAEEDMKICPMCKRPL